MTHADIADAKLSSTEGDIKEYITSSVAAIDTSHRIDTVAGSDHKELQSTSSSSISHVNRSEILSPHSETGEKVYSSALGGIGQQKTVGTLATSQTPTYSIAVHVNKTACAENFTPVFRTSISTRIKVRTEYSCIENHAILCEWVVQKLQNHYLNFTVGKLAAEFHGNITLTFSEEAGRNIYEKEDDCLTHEVVDSMQLKTTYFSFVSDKSVRIRFKSHEWLPAQVVTLHLNLIKGIYVRHLPVYMMTDTFGYVSSPCYGQGYPNNYDGIFYLTVSDNASVLIYMATIAIYKCPRHYLQFTDIAEKRTWKVCHKESPRHIHVFRHSFCISFHTSAAGNDIGFNIMFAILPRSQEPEQLPSKLFNCSMPSFHVFELMISCNLLKECEGNEDEQDCRYQENKCGRDETIEVGTKCYSSIRRKSNCSWFDAQTDCRKDGGNLPTFGSFEEWEQFETNIQPLLLEDIIFIGAQLRQREQSVPLDAMYRNIWQWVDGRTDFSMEIVDPCESCAGYIKQKKAWVGIEDQAKIMSLFAIPCSRNDHRVEFLCQFDRHDGDPHNQTLADSGSSLVLESTDMLWNVSIFQCPSHHVTRDFLYCDSQADCDTPRLMTTCTAGGVTVPMFVCQESRSTVHYTLVCDHMQHCSDNSDEDFCKYPECSTSSVKCRNGQCINSYQECNGKVDCYDGSDEGCSSSFTEWWLYYRPPGSISMDGSGKFQFKTMDDTDECPPTHFLCPGSFCLPVFLICNGIVDCLGREDEVGCDSFKCPGFYRCRGSRTCLHAQHMCDGVPQCPQQDDELLCDVTCPGECRCQGLAFVCTSNFSATSHLALRYLDASGSNMTPSDVRDNIHLIGLRMSKCRISILPLNMTFPNLRELDLRWNELHVLHVHTLHLLQNLRVLFLTGNPILHVFNSKSSGSTTIALEHLDLSFTGLSSFNGSVFASCPHMELLNISSSKLRKIAEDGFHFTPRLTTIDVRKCPLKQYPKNLLRKLNFLKTVHAENYKLCCEAMLPVNFDTQNCHSPYEYLASCEDLLKFHSYRVFLWVFASLSLVGNVFSVGARLCHQEKGGALGSFGVFVTHLCVGDFFMGIYLAIIGAADFYYTGHYLWRDDEWKNSSTCNFAGFLCLLSSEVSALIICLITLDRFLVLRFPFSRFHFRYRSAMAACAVVWAVGLSLAIVPLLPLASHWKFYRQTGICIPLPFTRSTVFHGYDYSFGISIILNLVLFLFISLGQVVIYWAVRANSIPSSGNTQERDAAIARRLVTVVMSDFLCWFPIGLLGLLASTGTSIPGDLNAAVAIFVLPINSALNPFLYTLNLFLEKRRKNQYDKLLVRLRQEGAFQLM